MIFKSKLIQGTLVKRYKRFLADVILENGEMITVYCPNTGSMQTCSAPGARVCLSQSENPGRKYPHTLEMIMMGRTWVGVNTGLTNQLVAEAILNDEIAEIKDIQSLKKEVVVAAGTRLDLMATRGEEKIYIEVKNCSMVEDGVAMFPDAVTARGAKHLLQLAELKKRGHEACIFYLVQRTDAKLFKPAAHIDQLYSEILVDVHRKGVKILVYQAEVTPEGIQVVGTLPFALS